MRNPSDLTSTYDQIEISRSDTSGGSFSTITTTLGSGLIAIDTTTASDLSMGFSAVTDATGDTTKYYKFRYKISASSSFSSSSAEFLGGSTTVDTIFRRRMRDTNSADYFFSSDDVAALRRDAIFSLWPSTWFESIDESLTTVSGQEKYSFPTGVTRVNDMQFIDSAGNVVSNPKGWDVRARQILFNYAPASGYTIRLFAEKMFRKLAEIPEVFDEYIVNYMMRGAYKIIQSDRAIFYKYNAVARSEGGNLPSIRLILGDLDEEIKRRRDELRRVRKATDINLS